MSATTREYQDYWINPRIKISALWTTMLFIFVCVDLFSLYRSDVRADIEAGKIAAFTIGQGYLQVNCLQLAVMTARLANRDYKALNPRLIKSVGGKERPPS